MRMEVDALDYAMGEVLSMEGENRKWRPVAFLSKSLNKTERNYEIHDKEMLAIIRKLESWRYLLKRVQFKFEIWTVSQIRYSLVVILELNGVSEVQYKDVIMIDDGKYQ